MKRLVMLLLVPACLWIVGCGPAGGGAPNKSSGKTAAEMKDFNKQRMEEWQKAKAAAKAAQSGKAPAAPQK